MDRCLILDEHYKVVGIDPDNDTMRLARCRANPQNAAAACLVQVPLDSDAHTVCTRESVGSFFAQLQSSPEALLRQLPVVWTSETYTSQIMHSANTVGFEPTRGFINEEVTFLATGFVSDLATYMTPTMQPDFTPVATDGVYVLGMQLIPYKPPNPSSWRFAVGSVSSRLWTTLPQNIAFDDINTWTAACIDGQTVVAATPTATSTVLWICKDSVWSVHDLSTSFRVSSIRMSGEQICVCFSTDVSNARASVFDGEEWRTEDGVLDAQFHGETLWLLRSTSLGFFSRGVWYRVSGMQLSTHARLSVNNSLLVVSTDSQVFISANFGKTWTLAVGHLGLVGGASMLLIMRQDVIWRNRTNQFLVDFGLQYTFKSNGNLESSSVLWNNNYNAPIEADGDFDTMAVTINPTMPRLWLFQKPFRSYFMLCWRDGVLSVVNTVLNSHLFYDWSRVNGTQPRPKMMAYCHLVEHQDPRCACVDAATEATRLFDIQPGIPDFLRLQMLNATPCVSANCQDVSMSREDSYGAKAAVNCDLRGITICANVVSNQGNLAGNVNSTANCAGGISTSCKDGATLCPIGTECKSDKCVQPCDDGKCFSGLTCRDGFCQDPISIWSYIGWAIGIGVGLAFIVYVIKHIMEDRKN